MTAQLIDSVTGGDAWADRFDRELTDIFDIQDELTQEIVKALKVKLTSGERDRLVRRRVSNVEAYKLLLRSREQMMMLTRGSNLAARSLTEAAIAIDPNYATAYALIAFTHLNDYANGYSSDPEGSLRVGRELAERAVTMDGEDSACHLALGVAYSWTRDLYRAEEQARRGLALSPNSVELMILLAAVQIYAGDPVGALATLDALTRLDPHYPDIVLLALLASCYGWLGRSEDAHRAWGEALRINPDFSVERRRQVQPFRNPGDFEGASGDCAKPA